MHALLFEGVYSSSFSLFYPKLYYFLERESLSGDHMPGVPPVPISNTVVKPRAANGSRTLGPARVGRCQIYDPDVAKAASGSSFFYTAGRRSFAEQPVFGARLFSSVSAPP